MTDTKQSPAPFEVNTTYEPYSNDPDYLEGNRGFIQSLPLDDAGRVLDLACGIGTLSRLLWKLRPRLEIVGIDLSPGALEVTARDFRRLGHFGEDGADGHHARGHCVGLAAASADRLPLRDRCVDAVVMGHSIHMLPDADALLTDVKRVLRPGGVFAFNTSFYAGTFAAGTESIYHDWVKESLAYIQKKDRELRRQGLPGIRRKRGRVPPAFTNTWPSPDEWTERLRRHGFDVRSVFERTVPLTQYSFETIGAYGGFASVMLSGYPVEISSEALQLASGPTLEAAGVDSVPRHWLEVAAICN